MTITDHDEWLTRYLTAFGRAELVDRMRREVYSLANENPEPFSWTWLIRTANVVAVSTIKAERTRRAREAGAHCR